MKLIAWAILGIIGIYLLSSLFFAMVIMWLGGSFWASIKTGLLIPLVWMGWL